MDVNITDKILSRVEPIHVMKMVFDLGHCSPSFKLDGTTITHLIYTKCTPGRQRTVVDVPYNEAVRLLVTNCLSPDVLVAMTQDNGIGMVVRRRMYKDFDDRNVSVICYRGHYSYELTSGLII